MNPKSVADALEFNHQNLLNYELSILALLNYYIIPSDEELIEFRKIINLYFFIYLFFISQQLIS
jgi:hypothetical protein